MRPLSNRSMASGWAVKSFVRIGGIELGYRMTDWDEMAQRARSVVESVSAPQISPFLADWPTLWTKRAVVPATLPVLRWLPEAADQAPPGRLAALADMLNAAHTALAWRQTYQPGQIVAHFLERYGWCEIVGLSGPIACDTLACGVLLLGPQTLYPSHSHVAQELYIPLSGRAEWQRGPGPFVMRGAGEAIVHDPLEPHAMRTKAAPLLALYLWRGAGLAESARLRSSPRP